MIKIFRKIRQQLVSEKKTSQYFIYALGEIVLVVLGILIALQINTWNENRKTHAKEKVILQSVLDEFKTNQSSLEGAIRRVTQRESGCTRLLKMVADPSLNYSKNETDSLMLSLKNFVSYDVSNGYIKGLLSTGEIRTLQNDTLKHLITNWDKEFLDNALEVETLMKQELNNIIIPFLIVHYSSATERMKRMIPHQSPFEFNYKSIFKNPQFENILIEKIQRYNDCKYGYKYLEKYIHQIISITERELQK